MDLFGFKKKRKARHDNFIKTIAEQSDIYLFDAYCALDMDNICGTSNQYNNIELRLVEDELDNRGYVNDHGNVLPYKVKKTNNSINLKKL